MELMELGVGGNHGLVTLAGSARAVQCRRTAFLGGQGSEFVQHRGTFTELRGGLAAEGHGEAG